MDSNARVKLSWNVLRYSYGIIILLVGLDKIFGTEFIVHWPKYISSLVLNYLPVSTPTFLIAIGIIEVIVAIMMLTKWPRLAGYISIVWLVFIAVNLIMAGYLDVAVRDLLLAIGAFVSTELAVVVQTQKNA
jgi:hypothetical protein